MSPSEASSSNGCTECGAARGHLFGCSNVAQHLRPPLPPEERPGPAEEEPWRLFAFPLAFLLAWLLAQTSVGGFFGSMCFGMWLHEFGHATAWWFSGRMAIPGPWFTSRFNGHSWPTSIFVFGSLAALVSFGIHRHRHWATALGIALLSVASILHSAGEAAEAFAVFFGDGGAMVFGTALASTYLLSPSHRMARHGLRWGWLVIGAMSWAVASSVWFAARRDVTSIPFGIQNDVLSDPSKLVDQYHWSERVLIQRYLAVSIVTLGLALALWGWRWWHTRADS